MTSAKFLGFLATMSNPNSHNLPTLGQNLVRPFPTPKAGIIYACPLGAMQIAFVQFQMATCCYLAMLDYGYYVAKKRSKSKSFSVNLEVLVIPSGGLSSLSNPTHTATSGSPR